MHNQKLPKTNADSLQLLNEIAVHALLHLYFKDQSSATPLSLKARNDILQKWLKPKLKSNRYRAIKKPLKSLTTQAKGDKASLESLLSKCVGADNPSVQPDLDSYLLLINEIEKKLGTTVILSRPEDVDLGHNKHDSMLCMLTQDLNAHFDNNNALISPISMLFRGPMSQRSLFLGSIYASNTFNYQVQYQDDEFIRISLELA